jgi:hypothetical protein
MFSGIVASASSHTIFTNGASPHGMVLLVRDSLRGKGEGVAMYHVNLASSGID